MALSGRIMGRVVIGCVALMLLSACGAPPTNKQSAPAPAGPAAAVQTNSYQGVGVVKHVYPNPKAPAIEIDHGDIDGLMPAMQMEFPVTDPHLLTGIAVNDRIDFTIEAAAGQMKVIAIKKK
ncbi:MAG TPA: copper-binding protein [Pyrinomonadaceae bacterium]|nr:copper-binding protein [Pyrinomonadaceae bacterium]